MLIKKIKLKYYYPFIKEKLKLYSLQQIFMQNKQEIRIAYVRTEVDQEETELIEANQQQSDQSV